jgi:hypothetical protein
VVALVSPPNAEEPKVESGLSVFGVVLPDPAPNTLVVGAKVEPNVAGLDPNPANPPLAGVPAGVVELNFPNPPPLAAPNDDAPKAGLDPNAEVVPNPDPCPKAGADVCPKAGVAAGVVEGCPNAGVVED